MQPHATQQHTKHADPAQQNMQGQVTSDLLNGTAQSTCLSAAVFPGYQLAAQLSAAQMKQTCSCKPRGVITFALHTCLPHNTMKRLLSRAAAAAAASLQRLISKK